MILFKIFPIQGGFYLRIEQLEYLLDIQNTLSLNKTAENFFTSHQVINNAIKSLEEELNCIILNRSPKGVTFTTAGLSVCYFASRVIAEKELMLSSIAPFTITPDKLLHGELDIYVIPRFSNKIFFSFYTRYSKKNPKVNLSISTIPLQVLYSRLPLEKPFVFLITLHSKFVQSEKFQNRLNDYQLLYEIVAEQNLGSCIDRNSKWLSTITSNAGSFEPDVPYALFNFAIDDYSMAFEEEKSYHLIDSFESQKELIKSGDYVGMCTPWEYKNFFQTRNNNLLFIPQQEPQSTFYYAVLYSKQNSHNPIITDVINELKKFFK